MTPAIDPVEAGAALRSLGSGGVVHYFDPEEVQAAHGGIGHQSEQAVDAVCRTSRAYGPYTDSTEYNADAVCGLCARIMASRVAEMEVEA